VFTEVTVTIQFQEDQDQYLVFISIELPSEIVNGSSIVDYFNSPTPYGSVRRLLPAILTVFEPNGMHNVYYMKQLACIIVSSV